MQGQRRPFFEDSSPPSLARPALAEDVATAGLTMAMVFAT
jgi:hypothetical protein